MKNKNDHKKTALWPFLVAGAVVVAAILIWISFGPHQTPAGKVGRLWARQGVEKPNVILVTMDTTRADHLACYGYPNVRTPNLDALAQNGILFEQCTSTNPLTLPAHCSILTGFNPTYHGVRINGNTALSSEQTTLAEVLSANGYTCGAFLGAFVLDGRWGLNQGFAHYDDEFDLKKYKHLDLGGVQRPGNEVVDAALAWLTDNKTKPFFAWVHLYDPHHPYEPPEPYFSQYNGGAISLYDGEIAFVDSQVGRLTEWLAANGLDRRTLVVAVGDHGEGLGDHGEMTHGYFIYDSTTRVPLILATPIEALRGRRVTSQVATVDIFPTVLEIAGIPGTPSVQGRSLLPLGFDPSRGREVPAYSESMAPNLQFGWAPLHGLHTSRFKLIDAPRPELYDISTDREEVFDLSDQSPDVLARMKRDLVVLMAESSIGAPDPQAADLDKETVERLAALGYIGAPVSKKQASPGSDGPLADPKDKHQVFEGVQRAGELITREKYAEAVEILNTVLMEDPAIPQALLLLANGYVELGRTEEAKAKLDLLLRSDPENVQALIGLANILLKEGKNDDVIALCKRTLSVDERNTQAYTLMGEVYMRMADNAAALPYLEKAVDIQPKLTQNRLSLAACLIGVKQYARAESLLKDIIKANPKFPLAHFNLGLLYEEQGQIEQARASYAEEISNFPNHFRAHFNFGKILFKLGDLDAYLEEMRTVVRIAPDVPEGYLFLARGLMHGTDDPRDILALVEKGIKLAKTAELKALGYFLMADVYTRLREPEKVRIALKQAESYQKVKG